MSGSRAVSNALTSAGELWEAMRTCAVAGERSTWVWCAGLVARRSRLREWYTPATEKELCVPFASGAIIGSYAEVLTCWRRCADPTRSLC